MVLKYDPATDKSWTLPGVELFQELINRVYCVCLEFDLTCYRAHKWATMWGKVGLLGLSSANLKDMQEYREVIEDQEHNNTNFTIFPRDALEKRGNLTVLLRENLRTFNTDWLPKAILLRSRIRGGLRLTHIKHYRPEDKTRDGVSKRGWRLALLQGCPQFMDELKKFDQDHRFPIGAGHIIIRGGSGRPKGTVERVRGSRGGGPRQQQQHQGRRDDQGRQGRGQGNHGSDNNNNEYDREYPPIRGRGRGSTRGRTHDRNGDKDRDHNPGSERERSTMGRGGARDKSANAAWGSNGPRHRRSAN